MSVQTKQPPEWIQASLKKPMPDYTRLNEYELSAKLFMNKSRNALYLLAALLGIAVVQLCKYTMRGFCSLLTQCFVHFTQSISFDILSRTKNSLTLLCSKFRRIRDRKTAYAEI